MKRQVRRLSLISALVMLAILLGIVLVTAQRSYELVTAQNQYIASQIEEEGATIIVNHFLNFLTGDRIVFGHKPYTHLVRYAQGQETLRDGEFFFLDKWQDHSPHPIRVWQIFKSPSPFRPFSPHGIYRSFAWGIDKQINALGVGYIRGFSLNFVNIPLDQAVVPLEEDKEPIREDETESEWNVVREDYVEKDGLYASIFSPLSLTGDKTSFRMMSHPLEILEIWHKGGAWRLKVTVAGDEYTLHFDEEQKQWIVDAKVPGESQVEQ